MAWYRLWQGSHILLPLCLDDDCRLKLPSSQSSHCITSTSCLVAPPILPAFLLANQCLFKIQVTGYRPLSHLSFYLFFSMGSFLGQCSLHTYTHIHKHKSMPWTMKAWDSLPCWEFVGMFSISLCICLSISSFCVDIPFYHDMNSRYQIILNSKFWPWNLLSLGSYWFSGYKWLVMLSVDWNFATQNLCCPASTSCLVTPPILPAWLLANQCLFKIQVTGYRSLSHSNALN